MADKRAERIAELIKPLRVKPGSKVDLAQDFDPGYKAGFLKKKDGAELLETGIAMLADYQARLAAQDTYGVLVCLQALDAGGKDGTIRHVMSGVNPQGVQVTGFKVPSAEELGHDYLWRYARHLPARGDIGIFNRLRYEEVLVVRVHPENLDRQRLPAEAKRKGIWAKTAAKTAAGAAAKARAAARTAARAAAGQAAGDEQRPGGADNKGQSARASRARGGASTRGRAARAARGTSRTQAHGQPGSEA
jgi:hypothetical protein